MTCGEIVGAALPTCRPRATADFVLGQTLGHTLLDVIDVARFPPAGEPKPLSPPREHRQRDAGAGDERDLAARSRQYHFPLTTITPTMTSTPPTLMPPERAAGAVPRPKAIIPS
jgi:hypothetical protein